jgi:hypothetical protein
VLEIPLFTRYDKTLNEREYEGHEQQRPESVGQACDARADKAQAEVHRVARKPIWPARRHRCGGASWNRRGTHGAKREDRPDWESETDGDEKSTGYLYAEGDARWNDAKRPYMLEPEADEQTEHVDAGRRKADSGGICRHCCHSLDVVIATARAT